MKRGRGIKGLDDKKCHTKTMKSKKNRGYIHRGGLVEERDRGPFCWEQFFFYPCDREG